MVAKRAAPKVDGVSVPRIREASVRMKTGDSFQNFKAGLGVGVNDIATASTYGFNPVSRNRTLLEWMYRGSWIVGQVVDCIADDMTRAGVLHEGEIDPEDSSKLNAAATKFRMWGAINDTEKWGRLYGGCIAVLLIDGQKPDKPLRIETIKKDQFKGFLILDRWSITPSLQDLVTELGPNIGTPKFYQVTTTAPGYPGQKIHYSRVIRLDGVKLPYWQSVTENLWGMSVIERLYDRLIAFDSSTQGAAQLSWKAHLRTYSIPKLREIIAAGGQVYQALIEQINLIRRLQTTEGITIIDGEDKFETHQYAFSGLSDLLIQFGQQLSGASGIPLVRLFGQSPAGLNSTGESDMRMYYDNIRQKQEDELRTPLDVAFRVIAASEEIDLPDDWAFQFNPLWQLSDKEKAEVTQQSTTAVLSAEAQGTIDRSTALKELKQQSRITGVFSNISDEAIKDAEDDPPSPSAGEGEDPDVKEAKEPGAEKQPPEKKLKLIGDRIMALIPDLQVVVETPKGVARTGAGWTNISPAHYGYVRGVIGADGDKLDCYIGPNLDSQDVWVIDQLDWRTGAFDEHKVMLGYQSRGDAMRDYNLAFSDGKGLDRLGGILHMTMADFQSWIANGYVHEPVTTPTSDRAPLRAVR